jgi:hypothetical protein
VRLKLLVGVVATIASAFGFVVLAREGRFTPGTPFTAVFALYDSVDRCHALPPEQLIVITPTDFYASYDGQWWHGKDVEHRIIALAWERPGMLIRARTDHGGLIEMVIERNGDTGFEIVFEETVEPTGDRVNRPRRSNVTIFLPCTTAVTNTPWLAM